MPKELSGDKWCARFPDKKTTAALADNFRPGCEAFINAMRAAGAGVTVSSTRRPAERAYLMHVCWRIHKGTIRPEKAATMNGVDIEWVHRKPDGSVDLAASRAAATAMVHRYNIAYQPALRSRHVDGLAIDMTIGWKGDLAINKPDGRATTISSEPRNGFNRDLRRVGKAFGLTKHRSDAPHWSSDGR